jgi:hypothetical protein
MGKSSPRPPPPPDYAGAAREQGTANLEAARLTARLSNPNISTPLGGQRVSWGRTQTNQQAYDAAMQQYQQALQQYEQRQQAPQAPPSKGGTTQAGGQPQPGVPQYGAVGGVSGKGGMPQGGMGQPGVPDYSGIQDQMQFAQGQVGMGPTGMGGFGGTTFQPGEQGFTFQGPGGGIGAFSLQYDESGRPIAPDISQFQYMTDLDTPFIEQYLTPEAQATLEAQQRVERAYAGLGEQAIGKVGDIYSQAFRPELSAMQTQLQGYGEVPTAPDIAAMGRARGEISPEALAAAPELAAMGQAAGGPAGGQFGMAGGGPAAPGQIAGADVTGVGRVSYGPQEGQYGFARGVAPGQRLQQGVDTRGLTALPTGAGMTAQEAILSRLTPTLTREQAALEQQLANQGLVRGGEAYNAAMQQQMQRANDLITQAALQGISVDAAMRQQGFSERQIQAELANQARLGQFGMGAQQAQLANQAVAQNQAQALAVQQAQNQAQAQDLQQRLAMGQFGREGQQLAFQMGQAATQAQNQAIAQNFAQAQAAQQAQNQALAQNQAAALQQFQAQMARQQQGFGQQMDMAGLYNAALAQQQQTALQQAQAQAALQNQAFGQAQTAAQFANQVRQQQLAEQMALRAQPLNEIAALMGGSQIQMPQFQGYTGATVAPAPIFGAQQAAGNFAQQNYANQVAQYNAGMGGLYDLAGTIGARLYGSDRRLKSNIVRVGTHPLGIGIYEYDIRGERQRGVMADEVLTVMPEAVLTGDDGYMMVNYGML